MSSFTVPEEVAAVLRQVMGDRVALRDSQGWLVGYFEPVWTAADLAEADRAAAENHPGSSLKDVWERIRASEKQDEIHGGVDTPSGGAPGQPVEPRP